MNKNFPAYNVPHETKIVANKKVPRETKKNEIKMFHVEHKSTTFDFEIMNKKLFRL